MLLRQLAPRTIPLCHAVVPDRLRLRRRGPSDTPGVDGTRDALERCALSQVLFGVFIFVVYMIGWFSDVGLI